MEFDVQAFLDAANKNPSMVFELGRIFGQSLSNQRQQQIADGSLEDREVFKVVDLTNGELSTARSKENALPVPFDFKSIKVQNASGADVKVYLVLGKNLGGRDALELRQNDCNDLGYVRKGWLYWDAQPGETMKIIFGLDIQFRAGSLVSEQAGGVSISEGTDLETSAVGSVSTTAAALLAVDATRIVSTIQNLGGSDIFLGDSTVTALTGLKLAPGGIYEHKNSDALYAITSAGTNADIRILHQR